MMQRAAVADIGAGVAGKRIGLIVNPRSRGCASLPGGAASLVSALEERGFSLAVPPSPEASLEDQVSAVIDRGVDAVFVAGGDGTVTSVAQALADTGIAIGVVPCGTMNKLALRIGLPADPIAAIAALASARPTAITVGSVNGRLFLYQSLIGRPARLARLRELQRRPGEGWQKLAVGAMRALARPLRRRRIRLIGPDGWRCDAVAAVVTVPAMDEDGGLRADAVVRSGVVVGMMQAWQWFRGRLGQAPAVVRLVAPQLAILSVSPNVRMTLDGETCLMASPLRFRASRGACLVLAPVQAPVRAT